MELDARLCLHDCEATLSHSGKVTKMLESSLSRISPTLSPVLAAAWLPFVLPFIFVSIFSYRRLFPRLSGRQSRHDTPTARRPSVRNPSGPGSGMDQAAAITFSATMAFSTALAQLIFCEITQTLDPAVRKLAIQPTIAVLMVSLVVVTPALEIHALSSAIGWWGNGKRKACMSAVLDILGLASWFAAFWWIGEAVLHEARDDALNILTAVNFSKGSLERIAIIGVSLMASLAAFAAVSSIWQTFGARLRVVTDVDIARKQHGLDATLELTRSKEMRLHALERKVGDARPKSTWSALVGTLRGSGNAETAELQSLQLECDGLESMNTALSNELAQLRARQASQRASSTGWGRLCLLASYVFSLYCVYRIGAASSTTIRRWVSPSTSTFATADPINNVLALVAKHWDPTIDRAAWSRQISFLLSGVMLLASFNAVRQTALLFSRFVSPELARSFAHNLALLVSQISATYVVSSALLLRSNLPAELSRGIEGALGAPLDAVFVERWFEAWFLGVVALTAAGIWVGRRLGSGGDWDDDLEEEALDVEAGGKMRVA